MTEGEWDYSSTYSSYDYDGGVVLLIVYAGKVGVTTVFSILEVFDYMHLSSLSTMESEFDPHAAVPFGHASYLYMLT